MSLAPKVVEFNTEWLKIRRVLDQVLSGKKVEKSDWTDRFVDVYNLTIAKPTSLGVELFCHISDYFETHVEAVREKLDSTSADSFIEVYHAGWMLYKKGVETLNHLFSYLNNHIVRDSRVQDDFSYKELLKIEELGLRTWKEGMLSKHKQQLTDLIVEQIDIDRRGGGQLKAGLVREVVMSYVDVEKYSDNDLEYYKEGLEWVVLRKAREYYSIKAYDLTKTLSTFEYVQKTLQLLSEEEVRGKKYLDASSGHRLIYEFRLVMVSEHLDYINKDIKCTIKENDRQNLSSLYQLLQPITDGLKPLLREFEDHYYDLSRGVIDRLLTNPANEFVTGFLKTHASGIDLINQVFRNDSSFKAALDKALNQSINDNDEKRRNQSKPAEMTLNDNDEKRRNQFKPAEMLVRYWDALLKKSQRGDGEMEERLNECITIFKYIDDKDFFNKYYSSMMAKRFICSSTCSMEAEELMINKLKEMCGYEYTTKLHRMYTDVGISEELSSHFATYVQELAKEEQPPITASVMVLQMGAWPVESLKTFTFNLPQEIERNICLFETFYSKKFTGRKLTWLYYLCQCELKLGYTKRPYLVTMAAPFCCLLLTLNNHPPPSANPPTRVPFEYFHENSGMTEQSLTKYLQILVTNKLLIHEQGEGLVTSRSTFSLNEAYSNKKTKVRINFFHKENTVQELDKVKSRLEKDRLMYLEAVIVRVMKARKVLSLNLLIQEVIEQSKGRFLPTINLIKKSLETLIERSFVERAEEDKNVYQYVA